MSSVEVIRRPRTVGRWCRECGYCLRGLPDETPCPECGAASRDVSRLSGHTAWARSVTFGLVLMLLITLQAVSSVLIQPFAMELGGTAPALNLAAPKLWAVPMLQRPIGSAPEQPGVTGTRVAILSLLAIWLITAPCPMGRLKRDETARLLARWTCVSLFGLAFGVMMASNGLWSDQLPPFRLLLVSCVELPGTSLLYIYFRQLALNLPGRERRVAFETLAWATPLVILAGAIMLGLQWWQARDMHAIVASRAMILSATAVYGCAAMIVGVAATASVAGLLAATFPPAFPSAVRVLRVARGLCVRGLRVVSAVGAPNARRLAVASGLVLLLICMLLGNECVNWMPIRRGLGGNLPFVNFPGPKMWLSVVLSENFGRWWDPIVNSLRLIVLNLLMTRLITIELPDSRPGRLAGWVRWLPVLCVGAGWAGGMTWRHQLENPEAGATEFSVALTVLMELPATLLLYAYLASLAETCRDARLAASFRVCAVAIVALVATSLLMCVLSRRFLADRMSPVVLGLAALYGAGSLLTAVWSTTMVVRLIGKVLVDVESYDLPRPRLATMAPKARPVRPARGSGIASDPIHASV